MDVADGFDVRRWNIIYPVYLNSKKTIAEGRKICIQYSVDNPTTTEILEVCAHLGFQCKLEDKAFPRDYSQRGRVRVNLRDSNGKPLREDIRSKKQLLIKIGSLIPKLQSRTSTSSSTKRQEASSTSSNVNVGRKGKRK